jgi:hypothetical protein
MKTNGFAPIFVPESGARRISDIGRAEFPLYALDFTRGMR